MEEPRLFIPKDEEQSPASLEGPRAFGSPHTHTWGGELLGKALEAKKYYP